MDIPNRHGNFFRRLLEEDAAYRTGCDPLEFRNHIFNVETKGHALSSTPSKANVVTKIWNGDGYILSTEIARHNQRHKASLKTSPPFPSVPRLRIASSVTEEEEMWASLSEEEKRLD